MRSQEENNSVVGVSVKLENGHYRGGDCTTFRECFKGSWFRFSLPY